MVAMPGFCLKKVTRSLTSTDWIPKVILKKAVASERASSLRLTEVLVAAQLVFNRCRFYSVLLGEAKPCVREGPRVISSQAVTRPSSF